MASKLMMVSIFILDLIAFGLAVAAEQRRSTATIRQDAQFYYNYCVYDSGIATGFGAGSFLFLLISQTIIMMASRCFCCTAKALKPGGSRACALTLFMLCWGVFLIAEACLLVGSVRNSYHTKHMTIFGSDPPFCETLRKGVFAAGAAFIFFSFIVSEFYYVYFSNAQATYEAYGGEASEGLIT